ncbi:MAG: aminopeptidase, partial [Spirochaetia bacterium]
EWIAARFGPASEEYRSAVDEKADSETFIAQLKSLREALADVYESPLPRAYKLERKDQLISVFKKRLSENADRLFRSPDYRKIGDLPINNAYISLYSLYTDDVPLLRSWYETHCGSDLKTFMLSMEKLAKNGDVKKQI